MCSTYPGSINTEYVRDLTRRRHEDGGRRFYRLDQYAYKRWEKSRDIRHAKQWLVVLESIKRRAPFHWTGWRPHIDRIGDPPEATY